MQEKSISRPGSGGGQDRVAMPVEATQIMLIWVAEVVEGAIHSWRLIADTPDNRRRFGLDGEA